MTLSTDTIRILKSSLTKALDSSNSSAVDDVLERLKSVAATAELLKSTGIGVAVNGIRKHPLASDAQRVAAKQLIGKWKTDVDYGAPTTADAKSHTPRARSGTPREDTVKNSNGKGEVNSESKRDMKVDIPPPPARRPSSISGPSTPASASAGRSLESDNLVAAPTGDTLRDKCIGFLYAALAHDTKEDGKTILEKAELLERLTFEEHGTGQPYKNRIKTLRFNLSDTHNPNLCARVLAGTLPIASLAQMDTAEMASDERKLEVEKAKKFALEEAISKNDTQAETDMFQCGKCKARRTKYYQLQTRSADEPMTTFVTCVNCGKKWKFC
ncbi:transcription factor S-II, central domain-containing protein [Powellomyces hirtus]|nr:transcription factor S-II, central domain-containing protein [Powellomyces hirtus]